MQSSEIKDKLVFRQTPVISLIFVLILFLIGIFVLDGGHATVILYIFLSLLCLVIFLLMLVPRITIADGILQRRYFFGYSSKRVNLKELSSVNSWFVISRGGKSYHLKLVDSNNHKTSIPLGSQMGPPTWNNEKFLIKTIATYVQKSNVDISKQTAGVLGLRSW